MTRILFVFGLTILRATSTVRAVIVPANLSPGLNSKPFDSNGTALSEPILHDSRGYASENYFPRRQQIPPALPNPQARCAYSGTIDITNFALAKEQLQSD